MHTILIAVAVGTVAAAGILASDAIVSVSIYIYIYVDINREFVRSIMLCGLNQLGHIRTLRATRRKLARGDDLDIILGDKFATNPAARAQDGVVVPPDQSYHLEREVIVLHSSPRTSGIGLNGHEEVEPTTKYICQTNA